MNKNVFYRLRIFDDHWADDSYVDLKEAKEAAEQIIKETGIEFIEIYKGREQRFVEEVQCAS